MHDGVRLAHKFAGRNVIVPDVTVSEGCMLAAAL